MVLLKPLRLEIMMEVVLSLSITLEINLELMELLNVLVDKEEMPNLTEIVMDLLVAIVKVVANNITSVKLKPLTQIKLSSI